MPQGQGLYLVQGLLAMNAGHAWYQYPDPEMNNIRQKRLPKKQPGHMRIYGKPASQWRKPQGCAQPVMA